MQKLLISLCIMISAVTGAYAASYVNIVCFVRFADEDENIFAQQPEYYDNLFNNDASNANSVYNFFHWVSYGQLQWKSLIYPVATENIVLSYKDTYKRGYYRPLNSTTNPEGYSMAMIGRMREQGLVQRVAAYLETMIPADVVINNINKNNVDNITLVISGNSATSSSELLWPHQDVLALKEAYIHGIRVGSYLVVFDKANGYTLMIPNPLNTGAICHEMTHKLGAYDLYTSDKKNPVGHWDLMSDNYTTPQGLTAHMRYRWGKWITEIPEITESGEYELNPLGSETAENVTYKISPNPSDDKEYFMIEYRKRDGVFDYMLPSSGLLVYRVNNNRFGNLSSGYEEYIFRPGGSETEDGSLILATLSSESGRTTMNTADDNTTIFYEDGTKAPFHITEVGACEETLKFRITFDNTSVTEASDDMQKAYFNRATLCIVGNNIKSVKCYSISGALVSTGTDMSTLPRGNYIAHITYLNGNVTVIKFIR